MTAKRYLKNRTALPDQDIRPKSRIGNFYNTMIMIKDRGPVIIIIIAKRKILGGAMIYYRSFDSAQDGKEEGSGWEKNTWDKKEKSYYVLYPHNYPKNQLLYSMIYSIIFNGGQAGFLPHPRAKQKQRYRAAFVLLGDRDSKGREPHTIIVACYVRH